MKIKDVTCDMLMKIYEVNGHENYQLEDTYYVRDNWGKMSDEDKKGWYTTSEYTFIPDAEDVFHDIINSLYSWDYYYYEMDDVVEDSVITDENKVKLQNVLNEIFSIEGCKSYGKEIKIDI